MASLRQLLDRHGALLLVDSASGRVQVGLLRRTSAPVWAAKDGEAGEQVFAATSQILDEASVQLADVPAFVYCDGPGSVLGIRTAATALRTWNVLQPRPVYSYCGLRLVASALVLQGRKNLAVIADARRDSWHHVSIDGHGSISAMRRLPTSALAGELTTPAGFRQWTILPAAPTVTSYDLAQLLPALGDADLFRPVEEPDAFLHEEPVYQTWTPQVHRAPTQTS